MCRLIIQGFLPPHQEAQAYCTCGRCIAGYISLRMKWLLSRTCSKNRLFELTNTRIKGYAETFEQLLPRSLNVFESIGIEDRKLEPDFLDLDLYRDLDHLPLDVKLRSI